MNLLRGLPLFLPTGSSIFNIPCPPLQMLKPLEPLFANFVQHLEKLIYLIYLNVLFRLADPDPAFDYFIAL